MTASSRQAAAPRHRLSLAALARWETLLVILLVLLTIAGGAGTVVGAALGALFLALINNALLVLQLPQEPLQAIYGAVILVAVSADALLSRRQQRIATAEARR